MVNSDTTKKAFSSALKELMQEKKFEKIKIKDICEKCNMNRKSFYYHFKDKYDLVNWIFDTEIVDVMRKSGYKDVFEAIRLLSMLFYDNKKFYRKALCISGQNAFSDHFRDLLFPFVYNRIVEILDDKDVHEFQVMFIVDAIVMVFKRWIIEKNEMKPDEFVEKLSLSIKYILIRYKE